MSARAGQLLSALLSALLAGLALLMAPASLHAQEEEPSLWERFLQWREERIEVTDSYSVSSIGPGYAAIQDTRMTPLVYRAPTFTAYSQERVYRPREALFSTFVFQFAYPLNERTLSGDATYLNPRGTIDIAYLRNPAPEQLRVGGSLSTTGNLRTLDSLGNSALNFDIITSINASARWEDEFTLLNRPAKWYVHATTPLFSNVIRSPAYNLSFEGAAVHWSPPWDFYRLRLNVGVSRLLKHSEENRYSIDYSYDVYGRMDEPTGHRLTIGTHSLTFGYSLKTK